MKTGIKLIADERKRQIEKEGWTTEHDAQWNNDEIIRAAICYSLPSKMRHEIVYTKSFIRMFWPWDWQWWKPSPDNRIRELEKAGALIAAEIDRLQRLKGGADGD